MTMIPASDQIPPTGIRILGSELVFPEIFSALGRELMAVALWIQELERCARKSSSYLAGLGVIAAAFVRGPAPTSQSGAGIVV